MVALQNTNMSNCIPCPPCQDEIPLTCEPYGTVSTGNRVVVEDDSFCTKTLANPTEPSNLVWDNGIKWSAPDFAEGWKSISSAYFAKEGEKLSVNSASGVVVITLPSTPNQFAEIIFADQSGSWGTNNVTILRNGSFIEGVADDLVLNTNWPTQIVLRYEGSTWRVYAII